MDSELDEYLQLVKPLGRFQIILFAVTLVIQMMYPFLVQVINFVGASPDYHCKIPEGFYLNESIPPVKIDPHTGTVEYSSCLEYVDPGSRYTNDTRGCTEGYEFSEDVYENTIITQYELVCDKGDRSEVSQSAMMLGGAAGALFVGQLADRFGRRPIFISSIILYLIFGLTAAFSPSYPMFVTFFVLQGTVNPGFWSIASVNLSEYLTPQYRSRILIWPYFFQSFGVMELAIAAYFIRDWRFLLLAAQLPFILALPFLWWYPESSRWLFNNNKTEKAEKYIIKIAKINKADISKTELYKRHHPVTSQVAYDGFKEQECTRSDKNENENVNILKRKSGTVWHIFQPPVLLLTLVLSFTRMSYNIVYFGFALSTGKLAGDPYFNFFLSGVAEIPGRLVPVLLIKKAGGRNIIMVCYFLSGITLLVIVLLPEDKADGSLSGLVTALALLGKMFITSIQPLLVMTALELFPTSVRSIGNGFTQSFGRLGGVLAPPILFLEAVFPSLPMIVMASVSFISSALIFLLPDARNEIQPRNADDLRKIMKRRKFSRKSLKWKESNINICDEDTKL